MLPLGSPTANNAWLCALRNVFFYGQPVVPRGKLTRELQHQVVKVDMTYPVVTIPERALSYQFMAAEAYWILTGKDTVEDIAPYNKHIANFSDNGVTFFGAYGPEIAKQLDYVVMTLIRDRDSRQAGLTIWRQNPPLTKDVPCTISIFAMIRQNELQLHVFMRSSDLWLGLPYDMFNFSMLGHLLCGAYNQRVEHAIRPGSLYLTAMSQHIYETNFEQVDKICNHKQPPVSFHTPPSYYRSPSLLLETLKKLRDTKPGNPLRWWEGVEPS